MEKKDLLETLSFEERVKYDMKAFEASAPLFVNKAWNIFKEIKIDELLKKGTNIDQIVKEKNIKNKKMLECMLETLTSANVLKYENSQYTFIKDSVNPSNEQLSFLEKYYSGSLEWIEFTLSKAKETLVEGNAPKETGFEHQKSLDLWDTIMKESPYSGRILAINNFAPHLKEGSTVLDFGCGGGIGLEEILKQTNAKIELSGAEVSKEYLERAKKKIKKMKDQTNSEIIKGNVERMNFIHFDPNKGLYQDKKYDVIFTSLVLNHIKSEEYEKFFNSIKGILKENGIFVVYQLIHQSRFCKNPICWIMHTVPSHTEYPIKKEYLEKLRNVFGDVKESLNGIIIVAKK